MSILTYNFAQVLSFRVAHGNGSILPFEEFCDGSPHDPTPAKHYCVFAGNADTSTFDEFYATRGGTGYES